MISLVFDDVTTVFWISGNIAERDNKDIAGNFKMRQ